jgi:lipid-A-disaccharide synthase
MGRPLLFFPPWQGGVHRPDGFAVELPTAMGSAPRHILVTAFEPSGDTVAASLIAELRRRDPAIVVHGLGGDRMAAAGAQIIERTTDDAVMGLPPIRKIVEHKARMKRLSRWIRRHPFDLVIPTDSPAANWDVCLLTRKHRPDARIVHLVAPQLWAWGEWRVRKMRRLSDLALCLLPFEPAWFEARGVRARFVGHPIFDVPPATRAADQRRSDPALFNHAPLNIAVLPGSRPSEWRNNWPTMKRVIERLAVMRPEARFLLAAFNRDAAALVDDIEAPILAVCDATDAVLHGSDAVLAVSGTVTLQVAAHRRPMVILYNVNRFLWHAGARWLIRTRTFSLPNLIGEQLPDIGRRVPEFVPHFGAADPLVEAITPLLDDGQARARQVELFDAIHQAYAGVSFATSAADAVEAELDRL